jgi:hypothetical protein
VSIRAADGVTAERVGEGEVGGRAPGQSLGVGHAVGTPYATRWLAQVLVQSE